MMSESILHSFQPKVQARSRSLLRSLGVVFPKRRMSLSIAPNSSCAALPPGQRPLQFPTFLPFRLRRSRALTFEGRKKYCVSRARGQNRRGHDSRTASLMPENDGRRCVTYVNGLVESVTVRLQGVTVRLQMSDGPATRRRGAEGRPGQGRSASQTRPEPQSRLAAASAS